ncbi:MAG: preprotein translocase subunit SecG [Deltaproteobacteria bacterium]|nr:preprotein translocase subunit SecG [Deltaproteobacteria bacterium]MBW2418491.1 preprotein translocase subunit SecG [Deltaproteobacteria bacterium]
MTTFLTVLHIMVCVVLIAVVLLQRGKGSDIGASLGGGGSNTVFGGRGAGNFLTKITTASAITFMLTSLTLSYIGSQATRSLIFDEGEVVEETLPLEEVETPGEGEPSANLLEEIPPAGEEAAP